MQGFLGDFGAVPPADLGKALKSFVEETKPALYNDTSEI